MATAYSAPKQKLALPQKALPSPSPDSAVSDNSNKDSSKLRIPKKSETFIVNFIKAILACQGKMNELNNKMDAIDIAYTRYKASQSQIAADASSGVVSGVDNRRSLDGSVRCDIFDKDKVTPPIVVAQVDTYVAYLSEIFCTGSPMFPVVSSPAKRLWAEQLEALLDDHAIIGGYARQVLLFIRDGVKYNFSGLEVDYTEIQQSVVADSILDKNGQTVNKETKKFNNLKHLNPRNMIWDWSVNPGDVSEFGDYAGYTELYTRIRFQKLVQRLAKKGIDRNINEANTSNSVEATNYVDDPQVSNYTNTRRKGENAVDWDQYFEPGQQNKRPRNGKIWEVTKIYARIVPFDYAIENVPAKNSPQIWCFWLVNGAILIGAERIITPYDNLPIYIGQPHEDGMGLQTQSVAEGEIEFQNAAETLFNIRFQAARRAVADRALYIADMIRPSDVNSPVAAAKIPVSISQLSTKGIADAYHQIPFDMRGTESTLQDAQMIVGFSRDLHGVNGPRQGSFQKGNKSVKEWDDTMGGSDARMRLPALMLEYQVFSPLRSHLVFNIFLYGPDEIKVTSQKSGMEWNVKIDDLRRQNLSFKTCDGYSPKSKQASTDVILAGMQLIGQSPVLQNSYASYLPGMFAQFMTLSGVKGFEEFDPAYMQQQQQQDGQSPGLPGNLPANALSQQAPGAQLPVGQAPPQQPTQPVQPQVP